MVSWETSIESFLFFVFHYAQSYGVIVFISLDIFRVSIFSQLRILAHLLGSFHPEILLDVVSPLTTHGGAIGVNLSRRHLEVADDSE